MSEVAHGGEPLSAGDVRSILSGDVARGDRVAAELLVLCTDDFAATALIPYVAKGVSDALAALERARPDESATRDAVLSMCFATVWYRAKGNARCSRELALRALELAQDVDDDVLAICHRSMALVASRDGDHAKGDTHYQIALNLAPGNVDNLLALMMTLHRAKHALAHEQFAEAVAESEAAVRLGRMAGHAGYEPFALSIGAAAKSHLGRLDEALTDAAGALRLRRSLGVRHDGVFVQVVLGVIHRKRREVRQAREVLEEAVLEEREKPGLRAIALAELGRVCAADDISLALHYAERAVTASEGAGRIGALLARAWVSLVSGAAAAATFDAEEARTAATMTKRPAAAAEAVELLGLVTSDPNAAAALLDDAAGYYRDVGDRPGEARVRMVAAAIPGSRETRSTRFEEDTLRRYGVRLEAGVADALTVVANRAPLIAVHSLGGFRVVRGGVEVPAKEWQSKKARDLLKILISHRGVPVPRSRLMELLWPNQSPATGGNRLSVLLSTLRRVLDPDRRGQHPPLTADRAAVAINLELVDVDVERFIVAVSEACDAHRRGDDDATTLLSAAEAMYVGEYLPDDPYVDWALELRDEAQGAYIRVLRAQAARVSDIDQKVSSLLKILRCDSYDEEAHVELIRVLGEAGRHGEAHRRYRVYARCMSEIGVTPMPTNVLQRGGAPSPAA
ncbi:BTAD domain-containing putative transcriptional regulator [Lentzea sp. NPDC005914]|uniref:AfsR/SARP family transcriptional regulator n=1 Tax=Lentzea sp. NPDC005914 TaxID=3154572 RepID=UPI0033C63482